MKKYFNYRKKLNCLVINPGILFNNFKIDDKFTNQYKFIINDFSFEELNNKLDFSLFDLILIDHSGQFFTNEQILILINNLAKFVKVKTLLSFYENISKKIPLIHLTNDWFLNETILHQEFQDNTHLVLKRIFDIVFVLITIPITFPLFILGCILNIIFSKGPILFKQERVGINDTIFKLYKIRTMNVSYNDQNFTTLNDERITFIGKYLRKTKIDELPQLFNILVGDMSLIGPRPERYDYVKEYNQSNPYYHLRHKIRPGITGWAQVNNPTATPEDNLIKLEYDLYYLKNMSLKMDLLIIFRTFRVILTLDSL